MSEDLRAEVFPPERARTIITERRTGGQQSEELKALTACSERGKQL